MSKSVEYVNETIEDINKMLEDINEMLETNFKLIAEEQVIAIELDGTKIKYGDIDTIETFINGVMLGARMKR